MAPARIEGQFSHYVAAVGVVFSVQLAALWFRYRYAIKRCSCWSDAIEKMRLLKHWLWNDGAQPEQDDFLQRLGAYMDEGHVNFALKFCRWMWVWTHILLIAKTVRVYTGATQWTTLGLDVLWLGASVLFALVFWIPSLMNAKSIPWWGTVFMMFAIASPWVTPQEFWYLLSTLFAIFRVAFGMMFRDMRHVVFWNLLLLLSIVLARVYDASDCPCLPSLSTVCVLELCTFGSLMVCINGLKELLTAKARLTIQAQRAEEESSAATALLESMSDAVVRLDPKLAIVGPASKFASLLIIPQRSVDGKSFESFVAEDEKENFRQNMTNDCIATTTTTANMFHVTLKDSWRNRIRVQVFHVCFSNMGNCASDGGRHLVGVKEFGDEVERRPLDIDTCAASFPRSEPGSVVCEVRPRQSPGGHLEVDLLTVIFDPYTSLVGQTLCGIPPVAQVPLPFLHFWGEVIDGDTPAKETFSTCVDLFARHTPLIKVTCDLGDVRRAKSRIDSAQGSLVSCQITLSRCAMDLSDDADAGAGMMALAILRSRGPSNIGTGERASSMAPAGTLSSALLRAAQEGGRVRQEGEGNVVIVIDPITGLVLESVPGILTSRSSCLQTAEFWGDVLEADDLVRSTWASYVQLFIQRVEVSTLDLDFGQVQFVNPDVSPLLVRSAACQMTLTRCHPHTSGEGQEARPMRAVVTLSPPVGLGRTGGRRSRRYSSGSSSESSGSSSKSSTVGHSANQRWRL